MTGTATVEVLTAEVRVLMVGSRQVTLSVYNQLDLIKSGAIEAFGRVHARSDESGWVYVVGRDRDTGVLARSRRPTGTAMYFLAERHLKSAVSDHRRYIVSEVCEALHRRETMSSGYYYNKSSDEATIERHPELISEWDRLLSALRAEAKAWQELPLIVLAGLR